MFLFISVVFLSIIDFHLKKKKIAETDKYKKNSNKGEWGSPSIKQEQAQ